MKLRFPTNIKEPLMAALEWWSLQKFPLDKLIAIVLLCFGAFVLFLCFLFDYFMGIPLTSAVMIGALLYLFFRNKLVADNDVSSFQPGNQIQMISHIIFIISYSLMVFTLWNSLYYRPNVSFILLIIAAASIVVNIFSLSEIKRSHIAIVLFKIIILSVTVYAGIYHEFPGIWGVDSWWHNQWTQETINLGQITHGQYESNDYFLFPIFHIWSAIIQIVTQVSTQNAIFIGTALMIAISSIFVFFIGEKLINVKVGLIAALVVPLTDQAIARSSNIIAMSLAFCFFPALIYLVLAREKKRFSDMLLLIIMSIAIILTHTIAALVTLLSLTIIYIAMIIFKESNKFPFSYRSVSLTLITFFGLFMLFRWMQPQPHMRSFFDVNFSNFIETLQIEAQFVMTGTTAIKNVAPAVTVLDQGGYILLLVFTVIGALALIYRKNRTGLLMALVLLAALLIILPQIFDVFLITGLIPDRWVMFSYVVLSIVAMSGLFRIVGIIPGSIIKICVIILVISMITFTMSINSSANADSPLVFNRAQRTGYTQSELEAINTLCDISSSRPIADTYYSSIIPYVAGFDRYSGLLKGNSRVFIQRNYYLHHPEWNKHYVAGIISGGGIEAERTGRTLITDYMNVWGIDGWSIIYRNNNVTIYSNASLPAQNK